MTTYINSAELRFAARHRSHYSIYRVTRVQEPVPTIARYRDPIGLWESGQAETEVSQARMRLPKREHGNATSPASCQLMPAEKLRAFLQSRQHLCDRGWLRSRPRDPYDLWYLQQQAHLPIKWRDVARLLPRKGAAGGLRYSGREDFLDQQVLQGIQRDWQGQLANFVIGLPSFEECVSGFHILLDEALQ